MSALLPRLDRDQTAAQLDTARSLDLAEITARMPVTDVTTTSSPLGGLQLDDEFLADLRTAVLALARQHGFPTGATDLPRFDALCARLVHQRLPVSPHEASEEDVWSHLTCCWLLDVAAWRWGGIAASDRRFRGDVNRNTFRRLWWRAEVLGPDIDLGRLGEDELVNIMERPTVTADRRLARTLAARFIARVEADEAGRMILMREAAKRLLRLTPMVDFHTLDDAALAHIIDDVLDVASTGDPLPSPTPVAVDVRVSEGVEIIPRAPVLRAATATEEGSVTVSAQNLDEYLDATIQIARRTGRVTNASLREVVPMEPVVARKVLQTLVDRAALVRRGQARGTYYVLPDDDAAPEVGEPTTDPPAGPQPRPDTDRPALPSTPRPSRPTESTLRRLMRYRRGR